MSDPKDFTHFGLDPLLLAAITEMGYATPTPIQAKAIPVVLKGKDVMGAAQTGTGKTAGFGLPMLQRLLPHANTSMSPARHPVRGLILTPTRELAEQVADNLKKYASKTALRVTCVYGGVDMDPQTEALRKGCEVVIATPGRLLDHIQQKNTSLSQVQIVVLDEADRMLDMGFLPDISRILNLLPKERQSLMFSATFSEEIKKLAANFLRDPQLIEVARRNATAELITQEVIRVHESEKTDALLTLLATRGPDGGRLTQVLVFVNAKIECRRLARQLQKAGVNADAIHGDKTQDERMKALEGFKRGDIEVLVATDVAARGLDIVELPVVINYDVPFNAEDYVHRIGRTGRAGATGLAIMLMTGADERGVHAIERLTKQKFDIRPLDVQRAPRRERAARREAGRAAGQGAPAAAVDDFFTKPYEPAAAEAEESKVETAGEAEPRTRKPAKVAALLGGTKR
jgi:superfamily II DNA/RNA helicase